MKRITCFVLSSHRQIGRSVRFCSNNVGFIGLGQMGGRMAPHLANKLGKKLFVCDSVKESVEAAEAQGAVACATPKEVASQCSTIITMLPSGHILEEVYKNPETGVFAAIKENTLLIDASTIGPVAAKQVAESTAKLLKGIMFCDAPVSGGVPAAEAGTLTFMVGADEMTFGKAKPFLEAMGKNVVHCGAVSSGQTAKVANNLLLAVTMIGVSEAMLLGTKMGMDPKVLAGVLNTSTGRCWSSDTYNPYPGAIEGNIPSSRGYTGGFACELMRKDLNLALDAGKAAGVSLPSGTASRDMYDKLCQSGMARLDFSSVLKYLDEHSPSSA